MCDLNDEFMLSSGDMVKTEMVMDEQDEDSSDQEGQFTIALGDEQVDNDLAQVNDDDEEDKVYLDKLPRPVGELNCRMARCYLTKLLRVANGGQKPAYGNPDRKPNFWPQSYWRWEDLTDVHTKPQGMQEPLQYSEMMKMAIANGYRHFGYDPDTYVDRSVDLSERQGPTVAPPPVPGQQQQEQEGHSGEELVSSSLTLAELGQPPLLPRSGSKLNCVQARSTLSRLLRWQMGGRNPVYGSPDTRPVWWPETMLRWCDVVDLRGRPPYLPDQKSYTDVLRTAIVNCIKHYGFDPEKYCEKDFTPSWRIDRRPEQEPARTGSASIVSLPSLNRNPPRLPCPVKDMKCNTVRICLSKMLWFHNKNNPPLYGNAQSRPAWWPDNLMKWVCMKNLRHRYDGPLGNSYTNCLKIALVRGYSFYGLNPSTYLEEEKEETTTCPFDPNLACLQAQPAPSPEVMAAIRQKIRKPLPPLIPLNLDQDLLRAAKLEAQRQKASDRPFDDSELLKDPLDVNDKTSNEEVEKENGDADSFPQELLRQKDWFPPPINPGKGVSASVSRDVLASLKRCKVVARKDSLSGYGANNKEVLLKADEAGGGVAEVFRADLVTKKYTDLKLVSGIGGECITVHQTVLAAQSETFRDILRDHKLLEQEVTVVFADLDGATLKHLIDAVYTGRVIVEASKWDEFQSGLEVFKHLGLLADLKAQKPDEIDPLESVEDAVAAQEVCPSSPPPQAETEPVLDAVIKVEVDEANAHVIQHTQVLADEESQATNEKTPRRKTNSPPQNKTQTRQKRNARRKPEPVDQVPNSTSNSRKRALKSDEQNASPSPSKTMKRMTRRLDKTTKSIIPDEMSEEDLSEVVAKGAKDTIEWLLGHGMLCKPEPCSLCGTKLELTEDSGTADGVSWSCPNSDSKDASSKGRGKKTKHHVKSLCPRLGSVYEHDSEKSLDWVTRVALCWRDNAGLGQCQEVTGFDLEEIFEWYERCTQHFAPS